MEELVAVLEKEAVRGLETRDHALVNCSAGAGRTRQLLDFHAKEGDTGEEIHGGLEILQTVRTGARKVVPVHGQVDTERVFELVEQLDELLFAKVGGCEAVRG